MFAIENMFKTCMPGDAEADDCRKLLVQLVTNIFIENNIADGAAPGRLKRAWEWGFLCFIAFDLGGLSHA